MKPIISPHNFEHPCCFGVQGLSKALLFLAMNVAGLFIHYLSDRTQRQSFLETRRCIEGRVRLERENHRQVESSTFPTPTTFFSNPCAAPYRSAW